MTHRPPSPKAAGKKAIGHDADRWLQDRVVCFVPVGSTHRPSWDNIAAIWSSLSGSPVSAGLSPAMAPSGRNCNAPTQSRPIRAKGLQESTPFAPTRFANRRWTSSLSGSSFSKTEMTGGQPYRSGRSGKECEMGRAFSQASYS